MKRFVTSSLVLLLLAWVGGANAETYTAVVTDITAIPLDLRGGPSAEDMWYDNSVTTPPDQAYALLHRTRTPELASPVLYDAVHNICEFKVIVQNTTLPADRTYGIIVKVYNGVDTDNGPSGDPLIMGDTGPAALTTSDAFAWIVTFTVPDCPEWDPNLITFPDGSSAMGNWLSVTYEGDASGPTEDNATQTSNGPASPLAGYFFSVDDRMMRPWPRDGVWGFTLQISE